jgi:hypothetical protein
MSPEQARGSVNIATAADVWSLGCVLYECLTGHKAFAGRTPEGVRAKVLLSPVEPVDVYCPEASPALVDLVHRMLSKAPEDRPASGAEAAVLLRALPPAVSGPRRKVGTPDAPTAVAPSRKSAVQPVARADELAPNCFVYFTAAPAASEHRPPSTQAVRRISDRFGLDMHELEDGSVLLESRLKGQPGAIAASQAAVALKQEIADGAVSVFAQGSGESLADALDRGSETQARVSMENLFADAMQLEDRTVVIDDRIAELMQDELDVDRTVAGPMLRRPQPL